MMVRRTQDLQFSCDFHQIVVLVDQHHNEFDHEAIIGSVKEAEEFHDLPPEESKKRLAILVKKMDLNDDKFIDRHELKGKKNIKIILKYFR